MALRNASVTHPDDMTSAPENNKQRPFIIPACNIRVSVYGNIDTFRLFSYTDRRNEGEGYYFFGSREKDVYANVLAMNTMDLP